MECGQPGDISARAREARDQPYADGIDGGHDDHRDCRRGAAGRQYGRRSRRYQHVNVAADKPGRNVGELLDSLSKPVLDDDVLPLDVAKIAQPFSEGLNVTWRRGADAQDTDARNLTHLLPLAGEWRGQRPQRQPADERPPVHSIT